MEHTNKYADKSFIISSVVAKKLGCRLKIKSELFKEGAKHFMLSAEVPVVCLTK